MPVQWKVNRVAGGRYRARMTFPVVNPELGAAEPMHVDVLGWSPFSAIKKLANVAKSVVSSPLLQAVIPPQVSMAVRAFGTLAKVAQNNRQVAQLLPQLSTTAASTLQTLNRAANRPDANRGAPPAPSPRAAAPVLTPAHIDAIADAVVAKLRAGGGDA